MKMKRLISILAIVAIFLLAGIGLSPVAESNCGPPAGPPANGNPDCCAGKFMATMCNTSRVCYNWVEGWQQGKTLAEPVSQIGTCYGSPGTDYKLDIPEGTVIEGYFGGKASYIQMQIIGGEFYFSPNLKLSQPATLYKLVDGEWVKVLSFTQVLNGKAS